jgi:DNA-binding transcriptional MocR family regulator
MRYRYPLTVPIVLDRTVPVSLAEQIHAQIRAAIQTGALPPGLRLPSTRTLAETLRVSRAVVNGAYETLNANAEVYCRPGSGTYVAAPANGPARGNDSVRTNGAHPNGVRTRGAHPNDPARPPVVDLRPGTPPAGIFPLAAWRAAWRWASQAPPPAGVLPPLGLPRLRRALTHHLRRMYGIDLRGSVVLVTAGIADGLRLTHGTGAVIHPAAVRPDAGATRTNAAESRGTSAGEPLVGDFTAVLTPHLGVGFAVVSAELAATTGSAEESLVTTVLPQSPGYLAQMAALRLLDDGVLERLILRCRMIHTQRRQALPALMHGLVHLPSRLVADPLGTASIMGTGPETAAALRAHGILVEVGPTGVAIGLTHLSVPALRHGFVRLDAALGPR